MNDLTERGIQALKSGNRSAARQLLAGAVKQDPNDAAAWLWLTGALDKDDERASCLRQVLRIDPNNQAAVRGLAQILEKQRAEGLLEAAVEASLRDEAEEESADEQKFAADRLAEVVQPAEEIQQEAASQVAKMPEAEAAVEPVVAAEAVVQPITPAPAVVAAQAKARPRRTTSDVPERPVFTARPSLVPALACFWLFMIGPVILIIVLKDSSEMGILLAAIVGLMLELVVIYTVARTFGRKYELTSHHLSLPFRGKRAQVAIGDIYTVECQQSAPQKLIGTGDIRMDVAVNGELARIELKNIARCKMRAEQIQYLVRDLE